MRYYCEKLINLLTFFIIYGGKITEIITKCLNLCLYINSMYYDDIRWFINRLNNSLHGVLFFSFLVSYVLYSFFPCSLLLCGLVGDCEALEGIFYF